MAFETLRNAISNFIRPSQSASMPVDNPLSGIQTSAPGNTYRGLFSSWFNNAGIEKEDFTRGEVSANNDFLRNLYLNQVNNKFNADQAQISRDFQVDFAKNGYKYAVEGMKAAGLNPLLAYQNGAADAPSSSPARSSGFSVGHSNFRGSRTSDSGPALLAAVLKMASGLYVSAGSNIGLLGESVENFIREDGYSSYKPYTYGKKY